MTSSITSRVLSGALNFSFKASILVVGFALYPRQTSKMVIESAMRSLVFEMERLDSFFLPEPTREPTFTVVYVPTPPRTQYRPPHPTATLDRRHRMYFYDPSRLRPNPAPASNATPKISHFKRNGPLDPNTLSAFGVKNENWVAFASEGGALTRVGLAMMEEATGKNNEKKDVAVITSPPKNTQQNATFLPPTSSASESSRKVTPTSAKRVVHTPNVIVTPSLFDNIDNKATTPEPVGSSPAPFLESPPKIAKEVEDLGRMNSAPTESLPAVAITDAPRKRRKPGCISKIAPLQVHPTIAAMHAKVQTPPGDNHIQGLDKTPLSELFGILTAPANHPAPINKTASVEPTLTPQASSAEDSEKFSPVKTVFYHNPPPKFGTPKLINTEKATKPFCIEKATRNDGFITIYKPNKKSKSKSKLRKRKFIQRPSPLRHCETIEWDDEAATPDSSDTSSPSSRSTSPTSSPVSSTCGVIETPPSSPELIGSNQKWTRFADVPLFPPPRPSPSPIPLPPSAPSTADIFARIMAEEAEDETPKKATSSRSRLRSKMNSLNAGKF